MRLTEPHRDAGLGNQHLTLDDRPINPSDDDDGQGGGGDVGNDELEDARDADQRALLQFLPAPRQLERPGEDQHLNQRQHGQPHRPGPEIQLVQNAVAVVEHHR